MPCKVACRRHKLDARRLAWFCTLAIAVGLTGCAQSSDGGTARTASSNSKSSDTSTTTTTADASASNDVAAAPVSPEQAKAELTAAVERLWQARVAEDWSVVFEYQQFRNDPTVTPERYAEWSAKNEPFVVRSYKIGDITVEGDLGWTNVGNESSIRQFPGSPPTHTERKEKWQRVEGDWKLIPSTEFELYPANPRDRDREAEVALRKRFDESWKARVDRDWDHLYQMTDPRDHDGVAPEDYAEAKATSIYISCDVRWIEVIGSYGTVRVAIMHKLNDPNLTKLPETIVELSEHWVNVDGQWYLDMNQGGTGS